jgi:hypothetical protein
MRSEIRIDKNNKKIIEINEAIKNYNRNETENNIFEFDIVRNEYKIKNNKNIFLNGAIGITLLNDIDIKINSERLLNETLLKILNEFELFETESEIKYNELKRNGLLINSNYYFKFDDDKRLTYIKYYLNDNDYGDYKFIDIDELNNKTFKIINKNVKSLPHIRSNNNKKYIRAISNNINYFDNFNNIFRHIDIELNKNNKTLFIDTNGRLPLHYSNFALIECVETGRQYYILNDIIDASL